MTKLLEQAFARVRTLPPEMQDQAAQMLFAYTGEARAVGALTTEDQAALEASEAAAARGEFATDDEVRAIWAKHGL